MSSLDALERISHNPNLASAGFLYCLVRHDKVPFTATGSKAKPNDISDFVPLEEIARSKILGLFEGIGISVKGSKVCALDVDKCFSIPFDLGSADPRAKATIEAFSENAYIEFSFSGKGLRALFLADPIENYSSEYYIKNDKAKMEYYSPEGNARYVTLTGRAICDNPIRRISSESVLLPFLDRYMKRPKAFSEGWRACEIGMGEKLPMEELLKKVRSLYLRDVAFQDLWFLTDHAGELLSGCPGRSRESHADFKMLSILYHEVTSRKDDLKAVFEESPYFKSKDRKHIAKWNYRNFRYFHYIYSHL